MSTVVSNCTLTDCALVSASSFASIAAGPDTYWVGGADGTLRRGVPGLPVVWEGTAPLVSAAVSVDGRQVVAGGCSGGVLSTDGGRSFVRFTGPPSQGIAQVALHGQSMLALTHQRGLWARAVGGGEWRSIALPKPVNTIAVNASGTVYALTSDGAILIGADDLSAWRQGPKAPAWAWGLAVGEMGLVAFGGSGLAILEGETFRSLGAFRRCDRAVVSDRIFAQCDGNQFWTGDAAGLRAVSVEDIFPDLRPQKQSLANWGQRSPPLTTRALAILPHGQLAIAGDEELFMLGTADLVSVALRSSASEPWRETEPIAAVLGKRSIPVNPTDAEPTLPCLFRSAACDWKQAQERMR